MTDRLFAVAALAFAGGYYALAASIPASDLSDGTGPAGLPMTYAAVLAGLAGVLLFQARGAKPDAAGVAPPTAASLAAPAVVPGTDGRPPTPQTGIAWRPVLTLLVGVGYVAVAPVVGYVPAIALLIAGATLTHGGRLDGRTVMIALAGALALWVLFVWFLGIDQPQGWLTDPGTALSGDPASLP